MTIKRVVLVCSGNTCRSPMAKVLLERFWQQLSPPWDLEVTSAGTYAAIGMPASEHAVEAMEKRGLSLQEHRSQQLDEELVRQADLILTMTSGHKQHVQALWPEVAQRVFTLGEYAEADTDVKDPFGGTLSEYEETATALEELLRAVVDRLRREGTSAE